MRESLRKTGAKYYPDLDKDLGSNKVNYLGSDRDKDLDSDKDTDSDLDSDSSDDLVYIQKPKTNKFKCEEFSEELTLKNYNRHIQSLKYKRTHDYIIERKLLRVLMRME